MRSGVNQITKLDFFAKYPTTKVTNYNLDPIRNSFVATSLNLFNPNWVFKTLNI